jgi:tRNA-Thr(GGU) m(6)t(6)A37 methyltransferase TsaA
MDSITPITDIANTTMNERNANFEPVNLHPIGVLRSSHRVAEQAPVQPVYARGCAGRTEIIPAYREGLRGPEGFSHGFLFYHLHRAGPAEMTVQPFTGDRPCGVFATRHPRRPNAIGLSLVRLVRIEEGVLHLEDLDVLDGAPLLDIKPFVPRFDCVEGARGGWTEAVDETTARQRGQRRFPPQTP